MKKHLSLWLGIFIFSHSISGMEEQERSQLLQKLTLLSNSVARKFSTTNDYFNIKTIVNNNIIEDPNSTPSINQSNTFPINQHCIYHVLEQLIPSKITSKDPESSYISTLKTIINFAATSNINRAIVHRYKKCLMRLINANTVRYRSFSKRPLPLNISILPYFQRKLLRLDNKINNIKLACHNNYYAENKKAEKYIKKLIKQGFNPHTDFGGNIYKLFTPNSRTLLIYGVYLKSIPLLDFFCDSYSKIPLELLLCAVELGFNNLALHLLNKNKDIDRIATCKKLFIRDYTFNNDTFNVIMKKMIESGLDPNIPIKCGPQGLGYSMLYLAIKSQDAERVDFLLKRGANKNKIPKVLRYYGEKTLLLLAKELGNKEIIDLLENS